MTGLCLHDLLNARYFLCSCIATDSRLSINDITSLDAADPVHGNVMGIYGFSFDMVKLSRIR